MSVLSLQSATHARARRTFWEPWAALAVAGALYLRAAGAQWGGVVALGVELLLAVVMRARLLRRAEEEIEWLDEHLPRELAIGDADRLIGSAAERVEGMFGTASSTVLATGMAASAFLLLFYAGAGVTGGIVAVAPKAFVATGYAILCALAFTRDAHHLIAGTIEPLRRRKLDEAGRNGGIVSVAVAPPAEPPVASKFEDLISQLISMQIAHLRELNETNRLLSASASERIDEDSGAVRVKLSKGLTEFRKGVERLGETVESLNGRLDALTTDESALFEHHRRELVAEIAQLPQQVADRAAGMMSGSIAQVEERVRQALQTVHEDENRRARDYLTNEFAKMRDQFELTERSVSAIATRFNVVVGSLDELASAFDRSAKSVVTSAADFTREAESLATSVTTALGQLEDAGATKASLLAPLTEAATAVRKASSVVATDMRKVAAERERLGRVRLKILELLPNQQGNS
ncbi:MAG TPA: hypothetical protein VJ276_25525 [Thermoanaerobaculia bacterium]|nr:hypothetical protein [Thermoanaerobaculia bacterium]